MLFQFYNWTMLLMTSKGIKSPRRLQYIRYVIWYFCGTLGQVGSTFGKRDGSFNWNLQLMYNLKSYEEILSFEMLIFILVHQMPKVLRAESGVQESLYQP